ncbi:MAG TPA: hypothetical protein VL283_02150 [Candidatus Baltobacteraceae bacterium]|jgi:NH3-dependent NAD+ synthetase|nr:hypothetical protein [Candidatus Baltobacteraceae bacterium]
MDAKLQRLIDWIRETASPARGLLVPVSGGTDSALTYWLCAQAYPEKTLAVHVGTELPHAAWFRIHGRVERLPAVLGEDDIARWARFLRLAIAGDRWLIGSRNRTEHELGQFSLASRLASCLPISGVWKSDVLALCRAIGVPEAMIARSLEPDPDCGRPAELSAIPYAATEAYLREKIGEAPHGSAPVDAAQRAYLEATFRGDRFKPALPTMGPKL